MQWLCLRSWKWANCVCLWLINKYKSRGIKQLFWWILVRLGSISMQQRFEEGKRKLTEVWQIETTGTKTLHLQALLSKLQMQSSARTISHTQTHTHTLWVITSRWSWPGGVEGHPISQTGVLIQLSCPSHLFKLAPRTGFHTAHSDRKAPPENVTHFHQFLSRVRLCFTHFFLFYSFKFTPYM